MYTIRNIIWFPYSVKTSNKSRLFFCGNGNANCNLGTSLFIRKRIIRSVKMVEFVKSQDAVHNTKRSIHDTIVLTVHGATGDKNNDTKHNFLRN